MYTCPKCGSGHDTESGMKIHYGRAHEGSISGVEVECDACGDTFRKQRAHAESAKRHYCSTECKADGYDNRVELTCDECGELFLRRRSRLSDGDRSFCSTECKGKAYQNRVTLSCDECGDTFERRESDVSEGESYCSNECRLGRESTESKCPTCGRTFDTEAGMKQHHTITHGESIAGVKVECSVCGDTFRKQRSHAEAADRHFCGDECKSEGYKNRVELTCDQCGEAFERKKSKVTDSETTFCSNDCQGAYRAEHHENDRTLDRTCSECGNDFTVYKSNADRYAGEYCSPQCAGKARQIDRVEAECANCGDTVERLPWAFDHYDTFYCSGKCRGEHQTHMNHPMWSGGRNITEALRSMFGSESWEDRRARLYAERDAECRMCGDDSASLHLHHIVPLLAGGTNAAENLLFLCGSCHRDAEWHTRQVMDHTVSRLAQEYAD